MGNSNAVQKPEAKNNLTAINAEVVDARTVKLSDEVNTLQTIGVSQDGINNAFKRALTMAYASRLRDVEIKF